MSDRFVCVVGAVVPCCCAVWFGALPCGNGWLGYWLLTRRSSSRERREGEPMSTFTLSLKRAESVCFVDQGPSAGELPARRRGREGADRARQCRQENFIYSVGGENETRCSSVRARRKEERIRGVNSRCRRCRERLVASGTSVRRLRSVQLE